MEKYNIPNTKSGYIELARRFFAPSETIEYTCYSEGWPGEAVENWRNECYGASGEAKVTAIYNVSEYLDPDVTENNNHGMYRHLEDDNYHLYDVNGGIIANRTSDTACSSQNRIRPNGIIDAPLIPINFIPWGSQLGFRPYLNRVQGSHVGRSMSTVIDQSAFL